MGQSRTEVSFLKIFLGLVAVFLLKVLQLMKYFLESLET